MVSCVHPSCDLCKHRNCPLMDNEYSVDKTIQFYLGVKQVIRERMKLYSEVEQCIKNGDYVGVTNVYGEPVTKPSDIYHNLSLQYLNMELEEINNIINELRTMKEYVG